MHIIIKIQVTETVLLRTANGVIYYGHNNDWNIHVCVEHEKGFYNLVTSLRDLFRRVY